MKTTNLKILVLLFFINILNSTSQNEVIIPKPNEIYFRQGNFLIDENTIIISSENIKKNTNSLQKYFNIILKTSQILSKKNIIHFWKGNLDLVIAAASNEYEVLNSFYNFTYLDYHYKNLALASFFELIPKKIVVKYHDKIIGLGFQIWGVWIPTNENMHYLVSPRIAANAEIGWTLKEDKNLSYFSLNIKSLQKRWTEKGIYFAPDYVEEKIKMS